MVVGSCRWAQLTDGVAAAAMASTCPSHSLLQLILLKQEEEKIKFSPRCAAQGSIALLQPTTTTTTPLHQHHSKAITLTSYPRSIRVPRQLVHHSADSRQGEECAEYGNAPEEINRHGEEAREEHEEPVGLDDHADQRKADKHHNDAAKEGDRALDLVLLEEEAERPVEANDTRQAGQEEDLQRKSQIRFGHQEMFDKNVPSTHVANGQ